MSTYQELRSYSVIFFLILILMIPDKDIYRLQHDPGTNI